MQLTQVHVTREENRPMVALESMGLPEQGKAPSP